MNSVTNTYKITVLPGDGIGPEVIKQAVKVLDKVAEVFGFGVEYNYADIGGIAIDKTGDPLPAETLELCKKSDAVLLGAVGGPKWDDLPLNKRPEAGLLGIRSGLGVFANFRPAKIFPPLKNSSPLKDRIIGDNLDILVLRELTGDVYFGEKKRTVYDGEPCAYDTMIYRKFEIERIARLAFETARKRKKKVTSVDKANVLEVSRFWREIVTEVAKDYPDVELKHLYVDNAAMQIVINPGQFDVIVTGNLFGDILSDEAAMITGSIGMLPSASLNSKGFGLYEPVHGSAPDIAGQNKANPLAAILSVAMMLEYSFNMKKAAEAVENAVLRVLQEGYATRDLATENSEVLGCEEMGDAVVSRIIG
ncbi:3-isopropylmalate dehydrogenase LeuB [Thermoclostridium stercorarium subsp. stercorarium DSM 8532]|jgi:3-isopropylmalate dehydrogenase|uniref:3-isopropylmalate dehydrogenase n=3 Tax=Thermoclostridium stercorarium TaxID=1510 RepID=L7VNW4_THES1|nr:3-isopropylmalate dehydrogenase [Thermoclostridium stercorarium]AGC68374.1 3-isopropylmalate dehydrogenase LeuB [Thermoclostridium stercorarium subsp. stercorarium DSM 8532]AGI39397.1 3-isopropylmalate dehydrogenase [Thermoclostridium stercorarium subsp. stercorarium DSM 8532]ANW98714.1 3-isopropylmalate dehydrogenase [Thermoclostridium stercorarium subsp. thermolacticum DSM 2910]ANX01255.1 3-isopropylmalate dehydrogenase [Thermoclostridium stercorarium subsp. leptospartum DSM 9219]UZQ86881